MPKAEQFQKLPAPWDRIFSYGTRTFVWALIIGILYILRPFFLLIFLTFVFAYIQSHGVEGIAHRVKNRVARVVFVFLILLGMIIGTGYYIGPKMKDQADTFIEKYPGYLAEVDKLIYDVADDFPALHNLIEGARGSTDAKKPDDKESDPKGKKPEKKNEKEEEKGKVQKSGTENTGPKKNGNGDQDAKPGEDPQPQRKREPICQPLIGKIMGTKDPEKGAEQVIALLNQAVQLVLAIGSAFLLSLLFSFLIVLDLPKLTRGIRSLRHTRIGFIYDEVAENIHDFGRVVGRALEAQLFIAIVNTILTGIGVYFMGMPNIAFLCTIVFFCSFIPVAGVFMSSAPICLVALQQDGIYLMLIAIALILIIHFIEAYFLNPKIYGHHLRMNAVLVLIVLTVGGKIFGVWGLVLGLPIVNYIFRHAIRFNPATSAVEPALATASGDKAQKKKADPIPR